MHRVDLVSEKDQESHIDESPGAGRHGQKEGKHAVIFNPTFRELWHQLNRKAMEGRADREVPKRVALGSATEAAGGDLLAESGGGRPSIAHGAESNKGDTHRGRSAQVLKILLQ